MTTRSEFHLPPVPARWARASDLVAALGCSVVRHARLVPGTLFPRACLGDGPTRAQLLTRGRIYFPADRRLCSSAWAHIAHEAVHYHVGKWSLDDEEPMLPFELELIRRIGHAADRRACYRYMGDTFFDYEDLGQCLVGELVDGAGSEWTTSPLWTGFREQAERKRLPLDGRLRSEV